MSFWLHESILVARCRAVSPRSIILFIAILCVMAGSGMWCFTSLGVAQAIFKKQVRKETPKKVKPRKAKKPKIVRSTPWYLDFFSQRGFRIIGIGQPTTSLRRGKKPTETLSMSCSFEVLANFFDHIEKLDFLPDLKIGTIERIDDDRVKVSFIVAGRQGKG